MTATSLSGPGPALWVGDVGDRPGHHGWGGTVVKGLQKGHAQRRGEEIKGAVRQESGTHMRPLCPPGSRHLELLCLQRGRLLLGEQYLKGAKESLPRAPFSLRPFMIL